MNTIFSPFPKTVFFPHRRVFFGFLVFFNVFLILIFLILIFQCSNFLNFDISKLSYLFLLFLLFELYIKFLYEISFFEQENTFRNEKHLTHNPSHNPQFYTPQPNGNDTPSIFN